MDTQSTFKRIEAIQQELNVLESKLNTALLPALQEALEDEWEHLMCEMEMLVELLANEMEDTREGCEHCSGCMYCEESSPGYDPADEI